MADGDGLENRCPCKGTVGSNPTSSANLKLHRTAFPNHFVSIDFLNEYDRL